MIDVIIPAQQYDSQVYSNASDCYLCRAVKQMGYKRVIVGPCGIGITVDGVEYILVERFNSNILKDAFSMGKELRLTLTRKYRAN